LMHVAGGLGARNLSLQPLGPKGPADIETGREPVLREACAVQAFGLWLGLDVNSGG